MQVRHADMVAAWVFVWVSAPLGVSRPGGVPAPSHDHHNSEGS